MNKENNGLLSIVLVIVLLAIVLLACGSSNPPAEIDHVATQVEATMQAMVVAEEVVAEEVVAEEVVAEEVVAEEVIVEEIEDTWKECGVALYERELFGDEPFIYIGFAGENANIYCDIAFDSFNAEAMEVLYDDSLPEDRTKICGTILDDGKDGVFGNLYTVGDNSLSLALANTSCEEMGWEN